MSRRWLLVIYVIFHALAIATSPSYYIVGRGGLMRLGSVDALGNGRVSLFPLFGFGVDFCILKDSLVAKHLASAAQQRGKGTGHQPEAPRTRTIKVNRANFQVQLSCQTTFDSFLVSLEAGLCIRIDVLGVMITHDPNDRRLAKVSSLSFQPVRSATPVMLFNMYACGKQPDFPPIEEGVEMRFEEAASEKASKWNLLLRCQWSEDIVQHVNYFDNDRILARALKFLMMSHCWGITFQVQKVETKNHGDSVAMEAVRLAIPQDRSEDVVSELVTLMTAPNHFLGVKLSRHLDLASAMDVRHRTSEGGEENQVEVIFYFPVMVLRRKRIEIEAVVTELQRYFLEQEALARFDLKETRTQANPAPLRLETTPANGRTICTTLSSYHLKANLGANVTHLRSDCCRRVGDALLLQWMSPAILEQPSTSLGIVVRVPRRGDQADMAVRLLACLWSRILVNDRWRWAADLASLQLYVESETELRLTLTLKHSTLRPPELMRVRQCLRLLLLSVGLDSNPTAALVQKPEFFAAADFDRAYLTDLVELQVGTGSSYRYQIEVMRPEVPTDNLEELLASGLLTTTDLQALDFR